MAMTKKKRGRPRTGVLVRTASGYSARITHDADGESVRGQYKLETTNRAAAREKLPDKTAERDLEAWASLGQALFASNEFLYLD